MFGRVGDAGVSLARVAQYNHAMLALALLLAQANGHANSSGVVSLGSVRKLIPADLRIQHPDASTWPLLLQATKTKPTHFTDLFKKLPLGKGSAESPVRRDDVVLLVKLWNEKPSKALVGRSERVLASYRPQLAAMDKALAKPHWSQIGRPDSFIPRVFDFADDGLTFPVYAGLRPLTYAKILQAHLYLEKGDLAKAEAHLREARAIGEHLCEAEIGDMSYITGTGLCGSADNAVLQLAQRDRLPVPVMARIVRHMLGYPIRKVRAASLRGELNNQVVLTIAGMPDPKAVSSAEIRKSWGQVGEVMAAHPKPFDRVQATGWMVDLYRTQLANLDRSYLRQESVEAKEATIGAPLPKGLDEITDGNKLNAKQLSDLKRSLAKIDNPVGRYIFTIMRVVPQLSRASFRAESRQDLLAIAVAANIHRRRTGAWPKTLFDLTTADGMPKFLKDPLTDAPFRYDAKALVVKSISLDNDGHPDRALNIRVAKLPGTPR